MEKKNSNAWSIAMLQEETERSETEIDEASAISLLTKRMERMERQARRSGYVLEDLQRRLLKAEQRISPFENMDVQWRRIGGVGESTMDFIEDGEYGGTVEFEEEDFTDGDIKPEEEYQLPMDIYTVVTAWRRNSQPFWIALLVISVQLILLGLLLVDQIGSTGASELIMVPANVAHTVHAAQALATIIAIMDQDDLRSAIEGYFDGLPTRYKGCDTFQHMTTSQWNCSCLLRFVQGFLSVFSSFVLAVQSETVFDVLLNFLGVKFVSDLDDLAFNLSTLGYFGVKSEYAAKKISEVKFQQDDRNKVDKSSKTAWNRSWFNKHAHVIGVFTILSFLSALFLFVLITQNSGGFSAQIVQMKVNEGDVPFAALFRGCYQVSRSGKTYDRRLLYEQIGFEKSGGKFGFCSDIDNKGEKAWTFMHGSESDPCTDFLSRTEACNSFNVLDIGSAQWFARQGQIFGDIGVSPVLKDSVDRECAVPEIDPNIKLCEELALQGYMDSSQREQAPKTFYKTFVNSAEKTVFTSPALTHPIFVESTSTPSKFELMFFTGQSWLLTDVLTSELAGNNGTSIQEYMDTDREFLSILEQIVYYGTNVSLVTGSLGINEITYTPLGLRWFRMREREVGVPYNYPTADQSRPLQNLELSCATCDEEDNPCSFGGICLEDGTCDCINGGSGTMCKDPPAGNGECNTYFNTELHDWDGGDCCGGTCIGPECGLGGLLLPFGMDIEQQGKDEFSALGYSNCMDPSMAPLTIELKKFQQFMNEDWYAVLGNEDGDPFCSTAAINVRCNGVTYLHFPQHILHNSSDCESTFTETIHVPYGSECELMTNIACFAEDCLDHKVAVYYGEDTSLAAIQSGNVANQTRLSFGVPTKCITEVLMNYSSSIFDLSTDQGMAATVLSNDGISDFKCRKNPDLVLERYALTVFNASVHLKSSNWEPYQCHGWGIPAVRTTCTNLKVKSLVLEKDAIGLAGTIPTELALLTDLEQLVFRSNNFKSTIPTELSLLTNLRSLELWDSNLSGSIPMELCELTRLSVLSLAKNQITGSIPLELAILGNLTGLFLDENQITGPVPAQFGNMSLVTLSIQDNQISGSLSTHLGSIPLEVLALAQNRIEGTIPSEFGLLSSSLVSLDLADNALSGELPPELLALESLGFCSLENNQFSGGTAPDVCII